MTDRDKDVTKVAELCLGLPLAIIMTGMYYNFLIMKEEVKMRNSKYSIFQFVKNVFEHYVIEANVLTLK